MSEETEWVLIGLDEKLARRQGVPMRVPIPKADFAGLAEKGMAIDQVRKWITTFLSTAPAARSANWRTENAAVVKSWESFVAKGGSWDKAQQAFAKNDFKGAIGALKMIANLDPNDHAAKMNLASALANTGDFPGALKHFEAVKDTFTGEADYHLAVGNVQLAMQQREDAIGSFVLALEANPECKPALDGLKGLGVLVAIYENPKDAASLTYVRADSIVEFLQSVWDAEPRDVPYFLEQIAYHESENRHHAALSAAERAIALGKDSAPSELAVVARISALRALGRKDDALTAAREWVAAHDDSILGHVELARCLIALDKKDEANVEADRAVALDPGNLMAIDLRFWPTDRHDLAQVARALESLEAHAKKHPDRAGALRSLARAKLVTGASEEAFELFAKAAALAPKDDALRAEWWGELVRLRQFDKVVADAEKLGDIKTRDWQLRWNEAEAYAALGRAMEARALFSALNHDESLHVEIRKRAKRAAMNVAEKMMEGA